MQRLLHSTGSRPRLAKTGLWYVISLPHTKHILTSSCEVILPFARSEAEAGFHLLMPIPIPGVHNSLRQGSYIPQVQDYCLLVLALDETTL